LEVTAVAETAAVTTAHAPVVTLPAEIDMANAGAVGEQFAAALAPGVRVVIADMTATTFCGSAGLNTLIRAHKRATANGSELRLLLPCPNVLRIMKIQGVDAVLPIFFSLEEALAGTG
jgi:anti-anti-sigma factor